MSQLILASQSPQRKRLLSDLGLEFTIQPSDFEERSILWENFATPQEYVGSIARAKVQAIADFLPDPQEKIIVGGDLVVVFQNQAFNKPESLQQAHEFIAALGGEWHDEVCSCVVWSQETGLQSLESTTRVFLPPLLGVELSQYLTEADPLNKAGGLHLASYQKILRSRLEPVTTQVEGEITTVIGLSVMAAETLLREVGVTIPNSATKIEARWRRDILGAQA